MVNKVWRMVRFGSGVKRWWLVPSLAAAVILALVPGLYPVVERGGGARVPNVSGNAKLVVAKRMYSIGEQPILHLNFDARSVGVGGFGFAAGYATAAESIATTVTYSSHTVDVPVVVTLNGTSYELKLAPKGDIKPGKYVVQVKWGSGSSARTAEQSFAWGVLAINTTQPAYLVGQAVHIEMGVLSSTGHTLCSAPVTLIVTNPQGHTSAVPVQKSTVCNGDTYVEAPDYTADYTAGASGRYAMRLRLADSDYTIDESFTVVDLLPFTIKRSAPTRLYPPHAYASKISVTANQDFSGTVTEQLPSGFTVKDSGHSGPANVQTWQVNWQKGKQYSLSYDFKAPLKSPASYKLAPLTFGVGGARVYQEPRSWQIAGDAVIAFVHSSQGAAVSATNFSFSTTAGNTIVLSISTASGSTGSVTAVTDSAGGTIGNGAWVVGPTNGVSGATNTFLAMFYQVNAPALTTIQFTTGNSTPAYNVSEYSNVVTTSPLDQSTSAVTSLSSTSQTGPSITTTNANDLVYAAMSHAGGSGSIGGLGGTSTPGTYTALTEGNNGTTHNFAVYQVLASTATAQVNYTTSASTKVSMGILALKGGTGSGGPTIDQQMRGGHSLINGVDGGYFWAR